MNKQSLILISLALLGLTGQSAYALDEKQVLLDSCYLEQIKVADASRSLAEIKSWCEQSMANKLTSAGKELSPLKKRIIRERSTLDNPSVITPHKPSYMLPITYSAEPGTNPHASPEGSDGNLDNLEAKFQISFKAPLADSLLMKKDVLFFGFTVQSYWQMYNSEISSPFRETNYQPEIFYGFVNDYKVGQWTNLINVVGIEHQSNGLAQPFSRSWNRLYAQFVWENDDWVVMFKPWYRLKEDKKTEPNQADGDDNPDIEKYMGYFEFSSMYKWDEQTFAVMLRNNLRADNYGAIQLDWSFPMGRRFRGYAQYFNGYGESLIDYNQRIERFGIGVSLTDLF